MKNPLFLALFILSLTGCGSEDGAKNPDAETPVPGIVASDTPTRDFITSMYKSVGEVYNGSGGRCSGVIVTHGLFVTAKHCFRKLLPKKADDLGKVILSFPDDGVIGSETYIITGSSIEEVIFDGDGNDIAYILYASETTQDRIIIDAIDISDTPPEPETPLHLVGFPSTSDFIARRLVSHSCKATGKSGVIEALPEDPGYDGVLYDTDCIGWFGNSGGPFFQVNATERAVVLLGVVAHTFDITATGGLDYTKVKKDKFGRYVTTVNMSSFSSAHQLENLLMRKKQLTLLPKGRFRP